MNKFYHLAAVGPFGRPWRRRIVMSALPCNNFIGFAADRFKVSPFHGATILMLVSLIDVREK
jgi:hypothetical protein